MKSQVDPQSVASWSRTYRAAEGLTQRELARKIRTSPGRIGEIERGIVRSQRVALAVLALMPADVDGLV